MSVDAEAIIAALNLQPHPEGGWYRQTWEAEADGAARPPGTAIYFLLRAGETSHWHRVDAAELWLWHAGGPLELRIAPDDAGPAVPHRLGPDIAAGERPQALVPTGHWQAARSLGDWALVSCVVCPGFRFEGFTLAAPSFDIPS